MGVTMRYGSGGTFGGGSGGSGGGVQMTLLWTNPDPTANFSAQTVQGDFSGYDFFIVFFSFTSCGNCGASICGKTNKYSISGKAASGTAYSRYVTFSSAGAVFETGYAGSSSGAGYAIPLEIVGVKR